jgi:hypothetical protein
MIVESRASPSTITSIGRKDENGERRDPFSRMGGVSMAKRSE